MKRWLIGLGVCALAAAMLVVVLWRSARAPVGNAAAVTGAFQHYTNDAAGSKLAVFRITNRSKLPIRREHYYELHVRQGSGWTNQPTVRLRKPGPVVGPGESETFSIGPPATTNRWRLCFPYEEHESWTRRTWRKLGLPTKHRPGSYAGFTDEVSHAPSDE